MSNLLTMNRFFVKQRAKVIELTAEYQLLDEQGNDVGSIRQEGQTKLKKFARLVSSLDQFMTHHLSMYDAGGTKIVGLTRPAKFLKSKVLIQDGAGAQVGVILQQNIIGKIRFGLVASDGTELGSINAENWRAWNFQIADASGREVGRITKQWRGLGTEMFTTADTYMVEVSPIVEGPLRLLALGAAAGIDTALKQDAQGFN